jgi:DNA-binding beta-propeller fold protein YncE
MFPRRPRSYKRTRKVALLSIGALLATLGIFISGGSQQSVMGTQNFGQERLISWEQLPQMDGAMCQWVPASTSMSLSAALQQSAAQTRELTAERDPLRVIRDPYPSFSSVAVDMERGEVVAGDENMFQLLVYDRLANTPPEATMTEPRRIIAGDQTGLEFVCGLHLDQTTGDVYVINADTAAQMQVFSRTQQGNVPPSRVLNTGHEIRGRGITVDSENEEIFIASQHNAALVVFRQHAEENEPPIRLLQGDRTRLANPHGIAFDKQNGLVYVTNHGQVSRRPDRGEVKDPDDARPNVPLPRSVAVAGSGQFMPPSINVYRRNASGNTSPLRVIEGPKTQLNWPAGIAIDERRGELYVANDTGNSVLVFPADASGDVAPVRVIQGPKTELDAPGGVFLDTKHNELWVSNYGNHSLNVYDLVADGNTAPLRRIRSGPLKSRALMIGNPGAVAYDTKREEILVPN